MKTAAKGSFKGLHASQACLKDAIAYECDSLARLGVERLAPETLRQAKFDGPDAVLWSS